jgi:hypothetical protein
MSFPQAPLDPPKESATCAGCHKPMPVQLVTEGKGDREETTTLHYCVPCREQALREFEHAMSI